MLRLASETDPSWAPRAAEAIDVILVDHAHLEKRAAGQAVNLLFRYPAHDPLHVPLSRLAREELAHFELVLGQLERRGLRYQRLTPSPYAKRLMSRSRNGEPHHLLDTLLVAALIEARSCERMKLLADALEDEALVSMYRGLLACEARHHGTYVRLAEACFPDRPVMERLAELARWEAEVIASNPTEPRLHNA